MSGVGLLLVILLSTWKESGGMAAFPSTDARRGEACEKEASSVGQSVLFSWKS